MPRRLPICHAFIESFLFICSFSILFAAAFAFAIAAFTRASLDVIIFRRRFSLFDAMLLFAGAVIIALRFMLTPLPPLLILRLFSPIFSSFSRLSRHYFITIAAILRFFQRRFDAYFAVFMPDFLIIFFFFFFAYAADYFAVFRHATSFSFRYCRHVLPCFYY